MTDQTKINLNPESRWRWPMVSVVLLIVYLAFFHLCLGSSYGMCIGIGIGCWITWLSICATFENIFTNRFEYWIHQLVGLDILFEGFSPLHEGLGFYYCAASFWVVFLVYHYVVAPRSKRTMQLLVPTGDEEVAMPQASSNSVSV